MNISQENRDGISFVAVTGRIDGETSPKLHDVLSAAAEEAERGLAIDLGAVDYLSSAGLRVILMAAKALRERQRPMVLFGLSQLIREVVVMAGFDKLIPIRDTEAEAVDLVRGEVSLPRKTDMHLDIHEYTPISSKYLRSGYKEDEFEMNRVLLDGKRILGTVNVKKFFPPIDQEFHLSGAMATIWIHQLAVIYAFHDIEAAKQDREVYLRDFSMKCSARIVSLQDILLELVVSSKFVRNGRIFYRGDYDIDVGSFVGSMTWFMDEKAFVDPAPRRAGA